MRTRWMLLSTFAIWSLLSATGYAAPVAVMPVQGVNLTEGQCEAVGMLFSNAFARDAHVAVSSPAETKPLWASSQASLPTAQRLGASQYVELSAIRLGSKVTLAGILFGADGKEVYRAETSAPSLDGMDLATAALAHALVWRQPAVVPSYAMAPRPLAVEAPPPAPELVSEPTRDVYPGNMYGLKGGVWFPVVSGRSFTPQMALQFDARIGPRQHFLEVGAGLAAPGDNYSTNSLQLTTFFLELGGSAYVNDASVGLYIGGGVAPGLWEVEGDSYSSYSTVSGAMFPVYAQLGMNFTRDIRSRIFAEFRIMQHLLGITDPYNKSQTFHPTVLAVQMGIGW